MSPLFFISRSRPLSPFFSLSFTGLSPTFSFSVFLLLYIPNLWTWQLIWTKYFRQHGYRNNFRFPLIDSLVVSALQDASGYAISRQNNLELHLGCHTCWLSYFTLVCLWCGRTVARAGGQSVYGHVITKFSWMGRLLYFPTHDASLVRFMRESSALILYQAQEQLIRMRLLFIQCSPMIQATRLLLKNLLFFIGTYHICITP